MAYENVQGAHARTVGSRARPHPRRGTRLPSRRPPGSGIPPAARRRARLAATAALALAVALTLTCTPVALARSGITGNKSADMVYYYGSEHYHTTHYVHLLDSDWVYCVDPFRPFVTGKTLTSEDPVKTGKLSQKCVTDLALAYKYVWEEDLYTTPSGAKLADDYERYAAAQVLIWAILVDYYPSIGPTRSEITVKGKAVTGDSVDGANNKAAYAWIAAHRDDYVGYCDYFDAGSNQSFAMSFRAVSLNGTIALVKKSADPSVTKGNDAYSLSGAQYGVFRDRACSDKAATLTTDEAGKAHVDDMPTGTYYVKETKAPKGYAVDNAVYTVEVTSGETAYVNGTKGVEETPLAGGITLVKTSSKPKITKGNDAYSLSGAQYGVYSDKSCTDKQATLTTDEDGKATVTGLAIGTYYVKETKAPKGYETDESTYTVKVVAGETSRVNGEDGVADTPETGNIALAKKSANDKITEGNARYSLSGAVYGVYADEACTDSAGTMKTDKEGKAEIEGLPLGTYYVKETTAPTGYELDEEVYTVKVKANSTSYVNGEKGVAEKPQTGSIAISKVSKEPALTDGNACYTLEGAVYGIYSDGQCTKSIATLKTDASGAGQVDGIPLGAYYVKETTAPKGYAVDASIHTVDVRANEVTAVGREGTVSESPQYANIDLVAVKKDSETSDGSSQGNATLQGAQFMVNYYDGYYDESNLPAEPLRSWTLATDENGRARAMDEYLTGGDELYRTAAGAAVIPLGTVTVTEVAAPDGYLLGTRDGGAPSPSLVQITSTGTAPTSVSEFVAETVSDDVIRGGVAIGKVDRQNGQYLSQGSATLEGATFEILSDNDEPVIVDGAAYPSGSVVKTIQTASVEGRFIAQTDASCLPFGLYTLREAASSEGYLFDEVSKGWERKFEIVEEGVIVDLTDEAEAAPNLVVRGDFEFSKADGLTAERLALVPFAITSDTTGERHIIVTDENGMASTAASWNSHEENANANDQAIIEEEGGISVDEEALDPHAGIWFNGRTDAECEPDDELGALPFDSYTVSELRCSGNEGRDLVEFKTVISRNNREIDLGTVDDNPGPSIGTTLADGNGAKLVASAGTVTLVDTVSYSNLKPGQPYTLEGSLHAVDAEGNDAGIVAEGNAQFEPSSAAGYAEVLFTFETDGIDCSRLVATEQLLDADGNVLCAHEDLADERQSVYAPEIKTELHDGTGQSKQPASTGRIELVDTVEYAGLTPGRTYTMQATLHARGEDGADEGEVLELDGEPVTARQSFTPAESAGTVEVRFSFEDVPVAGKALVAFEQLLYKDDVYATHADITDENQTITFPHIATTLVDSENEKSVREGEQVTLVDTVEYENLVAGQAYTLTGKLHVVDEEGADLGELRDAQGAPLCAKTLFTPKKANGSTQVEFSLDTTGLADTKLVAFEVLSLNDTDTVVAAHEDPRDEGQSITVTRSENPKKEKEPEKPQETPPAKEPEPEKPEEPEEPEEPEREPEPEEPESTPEPEKSKTVVVKKTPDKQKPQAKQNAYTVAKTGDTLPLTALLLAPSAVVALAIATIAASRLRRREALRVQRGPRKR